MFDAIVVGGGPAGLAAALTLGRALRHVLVLDSGEPRNAPAAAMHNFLTRDGFPPAELRRVAREDLTHYPTVTLRDVAVVDAMPLPDDGFEVQLGDGSVERARRLVLATGLVDELPAIEGMAALWGRGVFHCPYCHGFEVRGKPLAVLGADGPAVNLALHLTRIGSDVVLCTNGPADLGPDTDALLETQGVAVRPEPVVRVDGGDGHFERLVFADGPPLARYALFGGNRTRQRSELPAQLGCARFEDDSVEVDDFGRTSVPGLSAVGDMARRASFGVVAAVVAAAASGMIAAAFLDKELLAADLGLGSPLVGAKN
jgi:thioredoxin reductase